MNIKLFLFIVFLIPMLTHAQETEKIKVNNIDSIVAARNTKLKFEALEKRKNYDEQLLLADEDTVYTINISNLYYETLPEISRFNRVKYLNATKNDLTKVKAVSFKSDSLSRVNLSSNKIKSARFPKSSSLKSLILDENEMRRVPRSIRKLKNLQTLEISNNQIRKIPKWLVKMDSLQEVNLNFNHIKLNKKAVRSLAHINTVLLAGNNLTELPKNIGSLCGVRKINFSKNNLSELPPSFAELDSLTNIIFYKNAFTEIPLEITRLENLIELDFYYNQINEIPEGVGNLVQLKQLFLSFNNIQTLPDTLASLQSLKYFFVHHNQLQIAPEWITTLPNLERLDLSYNKIISVPDMSNMEKLTEIDLQDNQLDEFPWDLLNKENIKILILRNNPFIISKEDEKMLREWEKDLNSTTPVIVY